MKTWYRSCGVCIDCKTDDEAISDFMLRGVKSQLYGTNTFYVLEKEVNGVWQVIAKIEGKIFTNLENNLK
jgi:hypothetical protein